MYDPSSPFVSDAPFKPSGKAEFAEERLRAAIQWCELSPGERVVEQDLVDRFGLGRAGARAALAKLAVSGLVEAVPRAGWCIQPISGALIGSVIEARRLVEQGLGDVELPSEVACRLQELSAIVAALVDAGTHGAADHASCEYGRQALELLRANVNPHIGNVLGQLWDQSERIVRFLELKGGGPFALVDTPALLTAVFSGRREAIIQQRQSDVDRFEAFARGCLFRDDTAIAASASCGTHRPAGDAGPKGIESGSQTEKWERENAKCIEQRHGGRGGDGTVPDSGDPRTGSGQGRVDDRSRQ